MTEPVKFTFDQAFDGGARSRYDVELERVRAQAEQATSDAFGEGVETGRQQTLGEIEEATRILTGEVGQAVAALFDQRAQLESHIKTEMVQLAYTIAAKLAPALIRAQPMAELEALIQDCMATAAVEPRLVVRVSEDMLDAINDRVEDMKATTNFQGDIVLVAEPSFGQQDCRVEWPDGGTERRMSDIQHQIEDAVQRFVMSDGEPAMPISAAPQGDPADGVQ
ncbi:FliH/SctL family protein [Kordiimonas marina]|uniref:FliH/SctL family protein n=1 Tax=Kordiimonas marina TaxID=2872312 RepID=UPI001FF1F6CD|nr:FliH/SctL family protein [Kordiimonas marina]MCJ9429554.1 hypothetical protein [Kordiimonas marina]